MLVLLVAFQRKEESPPDWYPNKKNITFQDVLKITNENMSWPARIEDFKPTMFSADIPMMGKVKEEWLRDPQGHRKELESVRISGETKMNKTFIPSGSNSTDPMLRLNPFIRMGCQFEQTHGTCKITTIESDPEHKSLGIVKFRFGDEPDEHRMIHRYRNPYIHWIVEKELQAGLTLKCTKLVKIEGDGCMDLEWDFKIDWN